MPSRKWIEFRNDVIHNGKIPKQQEAIDYGQEILNVMMPIITKLKENYPSPIQQVTVNQLLDRRIESDKERPVSTLGLKTIIGLYNKKEYDISLEHELRRLSNYRYLST